MLNNEQREAAHWEGAVLLAAPPGSGKTKTLIARIAAIQVRNPADQVIAVSFTRDSADELANRVRAELGTWADKNVVTGTFHSLCKKQLELRAGAPLVVIEDLERTQIIMKAVRKLDVALDEEDAIRFVEAEKTAQAINKTSGSAIGEKLTRIYQELLAEGQLVDFQDLINNAVRDMAAGSLPALPCQHLLLDELQDIDASQQAWAVATARANDAVVFGVGDDDQCIFGFRHAQGQRGMDELSRAVQAKLFVLEHNYRSHVEIVAAASRLIEHNRQRIPKRILAANGPGAGITFRRFADAEDQAAEIVSHVASGLGSWGILARNRHLLLPIQAFLSARGIEHRSIGKTIWQERAVRTFLIALGIVGQLGPKPHSKDLLFVYVGAKDEEIEVLRGLPDSVWLNPTKGHLPRAIKSAALFQFQERFAAWTRFANDDSTIDVTIAGVGEWIKAHAPGSPKAAERDQALVTAALTALCKMKGSLKQRLVTVTRLDAHKSDSPIALSTFHGAKGLEWDYVWLVGAEDSVIPNIKSPIEEERRLFYVALTRARKRLVVSTRRGVATSFLLEAFPDKRQDIHSGYLHLGEEHGVCVPAARADIEAEAA